MITHLSSPDNPLAPRCGSSHGRVVADITKVNCDRCGGKARYRIAICTMRGQVLELDDEITSWALAHQWLSDYEKIQPNLWAIKVNGQNGYAKLVEVT